MLLICCCSIMPCRQCVGHCGCCSHAAAATAAAQIAEARSPIAVQAVAPHPTHRGLPVDLLDQRAALKLANVHRQQRAGAVLEPQQHNVTVLLGGAHPAAGQGAGRRSEVGRGASCYGRWTGQLQAGDCMALTSGCARRGGARRRRRWRRWCVRQGQRPWGRPSARAGVAERRLGGGRRRARPRACRAQQTRTLQLPLTPRPPPPGSSAGRRADQPPPAPPRAAT